MHVVVPSQTITVSVENGRSSITLAAGERYVMHDVEVAGGRQAGVFAEAGPLPPRPPRYSAASNPGGRMIIPFIGGLGDAVSMLPVLATICRQHPRLRLEVATTPGPAEVFSLCPRVGRVLDYPVPLEAWCRYDHHLTMEVVQQTDQVPGRALPEVFAAALGLELTSRSFELRLPRVAAAAAEPSSVPLVGVAVGEGQTLRSYPQPMLRELIGLLVRRGLGCVLLGHADPSWNVPVRPPIITDMRSRTPTVLELAVWLRAVDVVVCHDSFVMHLAGALGRPTVALFAPTSRTHASLYANAVTLTPKVTCSPCHETSARCPKGFDRCVAWDDAAVQPPAVVDAVMGWIGKQGREVSAAVSRMAVAL